MLQDTCHRGALSWSLEGDPDSITACNCTLCRRYGALWAYDFESERIRISGSSSIYTRAGKENPALKIYLSQIRPRSTAGVYRLKNLRCRRAWACQNSATGCPGDYIRDPCGRNRLVTMENANTGCASCRTQLIRSTKRQVPTNCALKARKQSELNHMILRVSTTSIDVLIEIADFDVRLDAQALPEAHVGAILV